ncbi:MAG TPA: mechanosensitive ion channel [Polyangiaceae bacterium LLY-WYZ-15_(1-7)]|nr:mechanosensitive ion channel [Polyangiaceae bacterium LLY-WYZ-15_(1-7)]HJL13489.1 mechanosensitive ion channel [Polyangiaceae bacterium LLY-WYZ-15_(1-7)]
MPRELDRGGVGARASRAPRRAMDDAPPPPPEPGAAPAAEPTAPAPVAPEPAPTPAAPPPADAGAPVAPAAAPPRAPEPAPEPAPAPPPEPEREPAPRALQPPPSTGPGASVPAPVVIQTPAGTVDPLMGEIADFVGLIGEDRSFGVLVLFLAGLAIAILLSLLLRRLRERLPEDGLIPVVLAFLHLVARLLVLALALGFVVRALPPRLSLVMLLAFGGFAVALGWSTRDVLPDLVAGFLLAFERRIKRGMWITGDGFVGQVVRIGLRSTLLHDAQGRHVDVPNRHIVRAPVTAGGSHEREHEVSLRIDHPAPAEEVRAALKDAVLASPWVYPGAEPIVLRDPTEPTRWRVRGRLLEAGFGARFEGELLERAERLLDRREARQNGGGGEDESTA